MYRKKITLLVSLALVLAAPAFSFTISEIAQGKYKIMDIPLIEGISYFQTTIFGFYRIARTLGTVLGLVCILWNAFRLWFGTESVKKACVDIITKFFLFIFLFNSYPLIVDSCINLAINIGMRVGGGMNTINSKFYKLREDYEDKVSKTQQQLEDILATVSTNIRLSESVVNDLVKMTYPDDTDIESLKSKYGFETVSSDELMNERASYASYYTGIGPSYTQTLASQKATITSLRQFYRTAEKSNATDLLKDERLGDAVVTLRAMNEVFYPNEDYDPSAENPVAKYLFNPFLTDADGKQTNLLSPSAMIKIGVLISDIISHRGGLYYDEETNTTQVKRLNFAEAAIHSLQEFIFTTIMTLGLVLATIFCCIQYVMCIFEYFIVTAIGVVFIPFCLWDGTKSFAAKLVTLFMSYFIKIMVMILCIFWVYGMLMDMGMAIMSSDNPLSLINLGHFIFACLLAWVVTQNGPQIALAVLNGSPQLSMGEFLHAAGTAVAGAVAARNAVKTGQQIIEKGHKTMQGGVRGIQTAAAAWQGAGQAISENEPGLSPGERLSRQMAAVGKMGLMGLKNNAAAFFTGQEPKGEAEQGFTAVGKGYSPNHHTKSGAKDYGDSVNGAKRSTYKNIYKKEMPEKTEGAQQPPAQSTLDDSARNADKNISKPDGKPEDKPDAKPNESGGGAGSGSA
jgi:type IV secretion system protein TrbL